MSELSVTLEKFYLKDRFSLGLKAACIRDSVTEFASMKEFGDKKADSLDEKRDLGIRYLSLLVRWTPEPEMLACWVLLHDSVKVPPLEGRRVNQSLREPKVCPAGEGDVQGVKTRGFQAGHLSARVYTRPHPLLCPAPPQPTPPLVAPSP